MVTARELIEEAKRLGARFKVVGERLQAEPRGAIPARLHSVIGEHKAEIIAEITADEEAGALVSLADAAGLELTIEGEDGLRVRHRTDAHPPAALIEALAAAKVHVMAALRRRDDLLAYFEKHISSLGADEPEKKPESWSPRGMMCLECKRVDIVRLPEQRCQKCCRARENAELERHWTMTGCRDFTVLEAADAEIEKDRGACISCGFPWVPHGRPSPGSWTRVRSHDEAVLRKAEWVAVVMTPIEPETLRTENA